LYFVVYCNIRASSFSLLLVTDDLHKHGGSHEKNLEFTVLVQDQ